MGFGFYGATTSGQHYSPTPLPPTGTDDTHKGSDYRTSKVGFSSPAPVPTASSKGTVSNSSADHKYSSRTVYPAQNTVRVERSANSSDSVPRATSIVPAVTMGSPSSAQAKAAQRWHLINGNAALDTSTVLEIPTVLTPSTVPEQFNLSKNTA